jgi:hypothetical protein
MGREQQGKQGEETPTYRDSFFAPVPIPQKPTLTFLDIFISDYNKTDNTTNIIIVSDDIDLQGNSSSSDATEQESRGVRASLTGLAFSVAIATAFKIFAL